MSYAWFCDTVFHPIVNPSKGVLTHLRCATFLSFDVKTLVKMRQKP